MNEDKPLYQIEDDEDFLLDNGNRQIDSDDTTQPGDRFYVDEEELPMAFGQPSDENGDDEEEDKLQTDSPYLLLLKVMFGPVEGWKELKRAKLSPDRMAGICFLPVTLIAALSCLASRYYTLGAGMVEHVIEVVVTFVSFFFGYFLLPLIAKPFLGDKGRAALASPFGRNAMMISFVTLAIFKILDNLLPSFEPVIVFLPLWTIYMIHRLVPVMKIPKERWASTTILLSILVIGLPSAWTWLFSIILP